MTLECSKTVPVSKEGVYIGFKCADIPKNKGLSLFKLKSDRDAN